MRNETVNWRIKMHACDDDGQAVAVHGVISANRCPHITISTRKGVSPVYSNDLLEKGRGLITHRPGPQLILAGVIDTFPRR